MSLATESLTIRAQAEQIAALVVPAPGRPPLERDPDAVQLLLAALADGNYRQTACRLAGIAPQSLYNAIKRAEAGEAAAIALVEAVESAEARAEAEIVTSWRKAVQAGPQYWAAGATFLERKSPDRWGKRTDDGNAPKVVVQIGLTAQDVAISVSQTTATTEAKGTSLVSCLDAPTTDSVDQLTERTLSEPDTARINAPASACQPGETTTVDTPRSAARGSRGGSTGRSRGSSARGGAGRLKGAR